MELTNNESYKAFIEDLKASFVEANYNVQEQLIRYHHAIGEHISKHDYPLAQVSKDSGIKLRTIQRCKQFYEKYQDLEFFLGSQPKNLSWHKIANSILPTPKEEKTSRPDVEELKYRFKNGFSTDDGSLAPLHWDLAWEWITTNFTAKK